MMQNDNSPICKSQTAPTPLEVERKYLVHRLPDAVADLQGIHIVQGYLAVENGGSEVRLRDKAGNCFLTVKNGSGPIRGEGEIAISREQFTTIWGFTQNRRVIKDRYRIPVSDGVIVDLDLYHDRHAGLMTAEVEFTSTVACQTFTPPEWFGREVTWDEGFHNRNLALHGMPSVVQAAANPAPASCC
ncbi:MAG: CYTH domain-containing protein [Magnetococcales bacterium]|nr:CYTH domain-containing protein [Magnetococcales bacterium]